MNLAKLLTQDLKYYLSKRDRRELRYILNEMEPVDIALAWKEFSEHDRHILFSLIKPQRQASLLGRLEKEFQEEITSYLSSSELAEIINLMAPDERADLLEGQKPGRLKDIFAAMGPEAARDAKNLMLYAPDTAGGVMTTEYAGVNEDMTARETLLNLQGSIPKERQRNINAVYSVDNSGRVSGACSIMNLITADPEEKISDISRDVKNIKILAGTDIEEVAALFTRYDMLSAPVIDKNERLVGIITIDDVIDVIRDEAEEDIAFMAGVNPEDFHRQKLSGKLKTRVPWLLLAWIGGIVAGGIIDAYEQTLEQAVALAAFIPVIMHMGGTIGVQSSTVVVRWLAFKKIAPTGILRIFLREFSTGFILSLIYAALLAAVSHIRYGSFSEMSRLWLVTGGGIGAVMLLAAFTGVILPLGFKKFSIDPAVATGPIITTAIDVLGLGVYFILATRILL